MRILRALFAVLFLAAFAAPQAALAGKTNNFYGDVVHVSVNSVKVFDPKAKLTLGFVLTPKFDQVFSGNGKTTYQMKYLKAGQYVRVVYDQKVLGIRHADKIYILNNSNKKSGSQIPSKIH
ncbi:MAG: hypothetical protein ABR508_01890 [Candidatus Baltobacteraceae bacterium]